MRFPDLLPVVLLLSTIALPSAVAHDGSGYDDGSDPVLTPAQELGRQLWYKATVGNARYHTYVLPQRMIGSNLQWGKFFDSSERDVRFNNWGLINDPECCTPGTAGCPAKSLEETYGFDWCPGDDELLKFVGKDGYRDPACDIQDPLGRTNLENPCELAFGTSAGAMGFRKFPNPKFDPARWKQLNGGKQGVWIVMQSRPKDTSIEPPFRIGVACGSCHIAFNPAKPPVDPNHPAYENILGTAGNQYIRNSVMIGSGMDPHGFEFELFKHDRPGTVDTSAVASDVINNPGAINAVINFSKRPKTIERIDAWRPVPACNTGDPDTCWCDPQFTGKCWERSVKEQLVSHFLKGGEDSIVEEGTVQRVYLNIGSCAESCFINHTTDLRSFDPTQRGYGQTPFDIGQCRRDCPAFRSLEDRADYILDFLSTPNPKQLSAALKISEGELERRLETKFGAGAIERGRKVFAQNCAECHSSQSGPFDHTDFKALDPLKGGRLDWLGNDKPTPASVVGTQACRAMHSNHRKGQIFESFASETYHERPADPGYPKYSGGGSGYYRNISLINVWAYAPFMHNNAIGPELCSSPSKPEYDTYIPTYVGADGKPLPADQAPGCRPFDPSVESRLSLFEASMDDLLHPDKRIGKMAYVPGTQEIRVLPAFSFDKKSPKTSFKFSLPAGTDANALSSFRVKEFAQDVLRFVQSPLSFKSYAEEKFGKADGGRLAKDFDGFVWKLLFSKQKSLVPDAASLGFLLELYGNCPSGLENAGHRFGEHLAEQDKLALTAFLETL